MDKVKKKTIGALTRYLGHDRRYGGHGNWLQITGVFRYDEPEDSPNAFIADEDHLNRLGGIRPGDGVEVHCWISREQRMSFVADEISDLSLLEMFKDLKM